MSQNNDFIKSTLKHIGNDDKSTWYVGIATFPKDRLFKDHNVNEQKGSWIYSTQMTEQDARDTEEYLLKEYPFKGGTGGGNNPRYVYAYKITSTTKQ